MCVRVCVGRLVCVFVCVYLWIRTEVETTGRMKYTISQVTKKFLGVICVHKDYLYSF